MIVWLLTFLSIFTISLISLIGVFTISLRGEKLKKVLLYLVSFAVGALFGDALIHLIPEAFEKISSRFSISLLIIAGILLFFVLEKFIHWRHCHAPECKEHWHPIVSMNILGNVVHNIIDGLLIGASFMESIPLGITTAAAILLHEIPQEMGNFGVLLHGGIPLKKAILINFMTALASMFGALVVLIVGNWTHNATLYLIPVTAGGFLYIAGSDLLPELKHENKIAASLGQLSMMILGVAIMASLAFLG
jgi:zinc and cadmium transporter